MYAEASTWSMADVCVFYQAAESQDIVLNIHNIYVVLV